MNIEKYAAYFHDGELIDIKCKSDQIIFTLSSAEVNPDEVIDFPLSAEGYIKGKIHIEKIKIIKITPRDFLGDLRMIYESGEILDLVIKPNFVELSFIWRDSNFQDKGYFKIEIEAEKIYWENIPNLSEKHL